MCGHLTGGDMVVIGLKSLQPFPFSNVGFVRPGSIL